MTCQPVNLTLICPVIGCVYRFMLPCACFAAGCVTLQIKSAISHFIPPVFAPGQMAVAHAEAKAFSDSNGPGEASSSGSASELSVKDRETARRNFKRVNSMQREQLGLAGQPLPDALLPEGITPEQLFPGMLA